MGDIAKFLSIRNNFISIWCYSKPADPVVLFSTKMFSISYFSLLSDVQDMHLYVLKVQCTLNVEFHNQYLPFLKYFAVLHWAIQKQIDFKYICFSLIVNNQVYSACCRITVIKLTSLHLNRDLNSH